MYLNGWNCCSLNPGSVVLPAFEDYHLEYHLVETDSPHARYAVLDYKNGRPDWEIGLRTGFMRSE